MKRATKVHAHDENNSAAIGDFVSVKECRPISKSKTWVLVEQVAPVIKTATEEDITEEKE